jgi:hypothetical protein
MNRKVASFRLPPTGQISAAVDTAALQRVYHQAQHRAR